MLEQRRVHEALSYYLVGAFPRKLFSRLALLGYAETLRLRPRAVGENGQAMANIIAAMTSATVTINMMRRISATSSHPGNPLDGVLRLYIEDDGRRL
jgi:hypothetical protein